MVNLINKSDKNVINNSGFVKNAVFYKDMLAFYDAYTKLMQEKVSKIPSFCYKNGTFYLEGICLLFKDYASELGFESIRLSLEYLKVIYYTIASYSEDGELPERQVLENEFNVYKNASIELAIASATEHQEAKQKLDSAKTNFDKSTNSFAKNLISSRIFDWLFIVVLTLSIISAGLSYSFYFYGEHLSLVEASIVAGAILLGGGLIACLFKALSKKTNSNAGGDNYSIQGQKRKKDDVEYEYEKVFDKYNKIAAEKYEYNSNFSNELKKYVEVLPFEEIVKRASEYKMLSYNMKLDLLSLFETQNQDIKEIIDDINSVTNPEICDREFERIYAEIESKDWLYFNNEVRFEFIKRMADISEFTFNFTVKFKGKKINPFGISVKTLSKEPIVYLKSNDDLFISATLDKFLNTKFIKSSNTLGLKGLKSSDALKRVKMEFASHFFDYEGTIKYNNLFYATKIQDGIKIPSEIIENHRKVPTFVYMKLKLIETRLKLSNNDAPTILQIAKLVDSYEKTGEFEKMSVIDMTEDDSSSVVTDESCVFEDFGYAVKYTFEDGSFIGYRINDVE